MWYTCSWNLCTMPFPQLRLRLRPAFAGRAQVFGLTDIDRNRVGLCRACDTKRGNARSEPIVYTPKRQLIPCSAGMWPALTAHIFQLGYSESCTCRGKNADKGRRSMWARLMLS